MIKIEFYSSDYSNEYARKISEKIEKEFSKVYKNISPSFNYSKDTKQFNLIFEIEQNEIDESFIEMICFDFDISYVIHDNK